MASARVLSGLFGQFQKGASRKLRGQEGIKRGTGLLYPVPPLFGGCPAYSYPEWSPTSNPMSAESPPEALPVLPSVGTPPKIACASSADIAVATNAPAAPMSAASSRAAVLCLIEVIISPPSSCLRLSLTVRE